jgi:hypothetical protein
MHKTTALDFLIIITSYEMFMYKVSLGFRWLLTGIINPCLCDQQL